MSKFVHLHTHSHYSLLSALPKIPDLVESAKADGMEALALTDNGNLYGAIEFYKECQKAGIKAIVGVDAYVATRTRTDKQAGIDNRRSRLVLLAQNEIGYRNLIKLVTISHLEGFYYKPRIDHELIEKYHEGLICLMPSFSGEVAQALKNEDEGKAVEKIDFYKKVFGDRLYLEITHHPEIENHQELMKKLVAFAKTHQVPIVGAHDVYYLSPADKKARDTLLLVNTAGDLSERSGLSNEAEDFSFIKQATAAKYFKNLPEALENTVKIAERCNLTIELGKWVFPDFGLPKGTTPDDELRKVVYEGFARRGIE
ncbi:MAG: PHP domain-containing protein, partial [Candidatus Paceibacterota bacterium]